MNRVPGAVELSWGDSCLATDLDYEVYEGPLGQIASSLPRLCSTGGATTATFVPAVGNTFYLVVPANTFREGSYGTDSNSTQRPQSTPPCLEQLIGICPL